MLRSGRVSYKRETTRLHETTEHKCSSAVAAAAVRDTHQHLLRLEVRTLLQANKCLRAVPVRPLLPTVYARSGRLMLTPTRSLLIQRPEMKPLR